MGSPEPTPRMYFFIGSIAEVNPGSCAWSLWAIPGPWSAKRMVFPSSRIDTTISLKRAWMKFSETSRMAV